MIYNFQGKKFEGRKLDICKIFLVQNVSIQGGKKTTQLVIYLMMALLYNFKHEKKSIKRFQSLYGRRILPHIEIGIP